MRELLTFELRDAAGLAITDSSWVILSEIREPIYRELVLEFLSTLSFDHLKKGHTTGTALSFRLGGIYREMSLLDFASRLGLYPDIILEEESRELLQFELSQADRKPSRQFDIGDAWSRLGPGQFSAGRTLESSIRDPMARLLHRFIQCVISTRKESQEKISNKSLWILDQLFTRRAMIDLPWLLANALRETISRREASSITHGFIITRLARSLSLLDARTIGTLTPIRSEMARIDLSHLRRMRVAHFLADGRTTVWGETTDDDEVHEVEGDDTQQPEQQEVPHVDIPHFAAPQLQSWEQVFGDRLSRIELEQHREREEQQREREANQREREENRRRFHYIAYGISQTQYTTDWTQRFVSQWTGPMTPPPLPEPYQPPPHLDPMDPDPMPPGFQTWEDWFARER